VASYDAKINVLLSGLRDLVLLEDRLEKISSIVNTLNKTPIALNVGGRGKERDLSGQLSKEVNDYVREWVNGGKIIGKSINAVQEQQAAFNELLRETAMVQQDPAAKNAVKNLADAWAETTQAATAYDKKLNDIQRKALGLQPQAVRDFEVARRQTFVENERRRRAIVNAGLQDELRLQQALLQLEEKSAAAANIELQTRGEIARLAAQGVNAAAFRAAQTGTQLALPAFQERGLQLLDDSVRLNESSRRIEQSLNGERRRGVRFLEKQTAEEARQVQLGILGARTNQLRGQGRAVGAVPAGGFPVSGPLQSPGFRNTQKKVGKFGENLALGAGFPLLFGGGPGAVGGSILGSFVGSGFGGQILGGAIGQILDQAVQKTAQLGSALQTLDLSKIEESGVRINANLQTQINLLRQAGAATSAQQLLQQQVLNTTGALPGTVEGVSNAVNVLSSSWSEFTAAAGVTLGIIGAPFAAALGAIINAVNLILKGVNFTFSAIGAAFKITGEWVVDLVGGQKAVENIRRAFVSLNTEIEAARKQYQPILAGLNSEVLLTRQILNLEKQRTTGQTTADKQRNANLTFQQNIARLNAGIDEEIRVANEKITEATTAQVTEQVRLLNVKRAQSIENEKLTLQLERQRIALDAQEKAARAREEADRIAEKAQKAFITREKEIRSLTNQINSAYIDELEVQNKIVEFSRNKAASVREELNTSFKVEDTRKAILENERQSALLSTDDAAQQQLINELYERRLSILKRQSALDQNVLERRFNTLAVEPTTAERSLEPIREEVNLLNAKILGQEKEYQQRRDIDALIKSGVGVEEATAEIQVRDQLAERLKNQLTLQQQLNDVLNQVGSTAGDVLQQLIFSTDSWTDSLTKALNALANILFQSALSGLAGTDGKGFFSFLTGTLGKRANGGPVTGGSPYIVGERGPELFVPGRSGTIVANDKMGGGSTNVIVNVDAKGSSVEGNEQGANQLGRVISAAVQSELIKQQRPGGLLAR
jgi:hypothetical protein